MSNEKMSTDIGVQETENIASNPSEDVKVQHQYEYDDMHQAALEDNPDKAERPSLQTILSIIFISTSIVAPIACGFIVATSVVYQIALELDGVASLGWIISGWSIASSVSFSLAGSLSDIFGRRYVILIGELISLVGAIVAAVAKDMSTLIAGSTCLGFSCGFVLVSYAAVPELLPNKYRGLGIACIEGFLTIPWVALAFLLGSLFIIHATWRWIYYICIIYSTISFIGTAVFYHPPKGLQMKLSTKSRKQQFLDLDFIGIALYATGLTSILLGLSWGGTTGHAWNSASVIAPIILGAFAFTASFVYDFVVVERSGRHALFPREMLSRFREFTASLVVIFIAGMVYYTMSGLLPQATQQVYGATSLQTGILLLPNGLGQMFFTCFIPMLFHLTGHPSLYVLTAVSVQTLFTGLYAYAIGGNKAAWSAFQFFGAGPFGLIVVATVLNASLHVRPSELGIAVGLLGTFRSMGGSVGNAIFGAILRSVSGEELPRRIIGAAFAHGYKGDLTDLITATIEAANGVPNAFASIANITPVIEEAGLQAYQQAYAQAYRMVFYSTIPFGVLAIIGCLFIKDSTKYMTNHVHVHLEKAVIHKTHRHETEKGEQSG